MDPREVLDRVRRGALPGWGTVDGSPALLIDRADGASVWDADGREYLDFSSQLVATNLGQGNAAVADAIAAQARRLAYANPGLATRPRAELFQRLDGVLPEGLRRYFLSTSGTEANEAALKIARLATGRRKVLARTRSYHGSTAASLSVSGDYRRLPSDGVQSVEGTVEAPDCYCYRCPLGLSYPSCGVACADEVEDRLAEDPEIGAMIVEPIVGTNGVIVPVPEYLPRIRAITARRGVVLIADEVMTGWGRTGAWFAVDHWGVRPDILTTAKGLTGGYVPLGLTAVTEPLADGFRDRFFPHGHTYEGHPVALAAASAAIDEYRRGGLIERSRREGEGLLRQLREVADRHPSVGDVRGLGLFAAVELVRDRRSKRPFQTAADKAEGRPLVVDEVAAAMRQDGVMVLPWISHLILAPPLTVGPEQIDRALGSLDRALALADARASLPRDPTFKT